MGRSQRYSVARALSSGLLLLCLTLPGGCGPSAAPNLTSNPLDGAEYRLQPGDQVLITNTLDESYGTAAIVGPDGRIVLAGLREPVMAQGATLPSLTQRVTELYTSSGILRDPLISISLGRLASRQVYVTGEVTRPGALTLAGPRNVMQVLITRGGPLVTADLDAVEILRTFPNGRTRLMTVKLSDVLSGRDMSQNVPVHAMDVVIVPKSGIADLDQWVDQHIRLALPVPIQVLFTLTNGGFVPR